MENFLKQVKFDENGLVTAVIQDAQNKDVLMVGYMNRESFEQTLTTGRVTFWSRSRKKFWIKGETSGHTQTVKTIYFDCDVDCLLIQVDQIGGACHEGYRTCFFRKVNPDGRVEVIQQKVFDPNQVY